MIFSEKKHLAYGFGGLMIGILLGVHIVPGLFMYKESGRYEGRHDTQKGYGMHSDLDARFIEHMILHHAGAISMAQLALEKATTDEVRALAEAVITVQEQEIAQMTGWYTEWFGKDLEDLETMHGMQGKDMVTFGGKPLDLSTSEDFDKEFVLQMIPHHEMAVVMAQMLKAGTSRPEMETLADAIIESQSKEIEMMQLWLLARAEGREE